MPRRRARPTAASMARPTRPARSRSPRPSAARGSSRASTCSPPARCRSPASRSPRRWAAISATTAAIACRPTSTSTRDRGVDRGSISPGFSTGVESYEYSKQPMNNLAFESGAARRSCTRRSSTRRARPARPRPRTSLALVQHFAAGAQRARPLRVPGRHVPGRQRERRRQPDRRGHRPRTRSAGPASGRPTHVFASFDPTIAPTSDVALACSITLRRRSRAAAGALELRRLRVRRDARCTCAIARRRSIRRSRPAPTASRRWKYGLWVLNYLQVMHDATEAAVATVDAGRPRAASARRATRSSAPTTAGAPTARRHVPRLERHRGLPGADVHRRARQPRRRLARAPHDRPTARRSSGFATLAGRARLRLRRAAALVPGADRGHRDRRRQRLSRSPRYALASADSDAARSASGSRWATRSSTRSPTRATRDVGGAQPALAYFDGDPFPADDQLADGEATLHDRALAMMRVALVDLDRLHADPASGVLVDDVTMTGATPRARHDGRRRRRSRTRCSGCARRCARSSSQLELYSNNTPDTAIAATPLDALPIALPGRRDADVHRRALEQLAARAGRAALRSPHRRDRPRVRRLGRRGRRADRRRRRARRAHRRDPRAVRRVPRDRRRALPRSRDRGVRSHARRVFYDAERADLRARRRRRSTTSSTRRCASRCCRARCATCTSWSRRGPAARRSSRCSRSALGAARTSSCSTAGTIAIATASSTGPTSA